MASKEEVLFGVSFSHDLEVIDHDETLLYRGCIELMPCSDSYGLSPCVVWGWHELRTFSDKIQLDIQMDNPLVYAKTSHALTGISGQTKLKEMDKNGNQ